MLNYSIKGKKMQKLRRDASLLRKINKVRLDVEIPQETHEVRPLAGLPIAQVEETKIGTAKVEGDNVPYWKIGLRVTR